MRQVVFFLILFTGLVQVGLSLAEPPPLLHARLKIEGVHKKSSARKIHEALLSVPGVKKADVKIPRKWLIFRDYNNVNAIVEFEQGSLTSETLIRAVEQISEPLNIYKVKFIE